ncbi:sugar ABC transporter substrate-binding protein [Haloarcula amylovorans]|uniref:sugar ABC transporter substrate-binding protein n=1 Tax=Haloarcula amylovorans TaxID=2562280 RepID=UPI001430F0D6|nr:sugar ABC transporter substrate-binding protein [Halomicroarcula amylolytica]
MVSDSHSDGRISRRKYITAVGVGATVGLAGCGGDGGDGGGDGGGGTATGDGGGATTGGETATTGSDGGSGQSYKFGFSIKNMNNPWLQVFRKIGEVYAQELGHEIQVTQAGGQAQRQIQNVRSMLNSGIDGLLISPYSSDAAVGVIERAAEQDIPVYTANSSAPTDAIELFTGFGSFNAGYRAGELMIEALNDTYSGSRVVDLVGDQSDQSAVRRSEGFRQAISEADGIEIVQVIYNKGWSQQRATQNLSAFLESDSDIDGIYSVWGGGALAAVNVLDQMGMLATMDDTENYIPIMNIDGFPGVLDNIREGYIHTTLQQPMPFYAPISMEYMIHQLNSGEAAIPQPDSEVTAADSANLPNEVAVQNIEYNGVQPLSNSYWSPGTVTQWSSGDTDYYPWLQPKTVAITQENVDAEYLWGNYASDLLD